VEKSVCPIKQEIIDNKTGCYLPQKRSPMGYWCISFASKKAEKREKKEANG